MLKINEIFYSIQGEGIRAGCPVIFVRLQGCTMDCCFCDTAYAQDPEEGVYFREGEVLAKIQEQQAPNVPICRNICITGGEPLEQGLVPLCRQLKYYGYHIQIETNGFNSLASRDNQELASLIDHWTVSPKKTHCITGDIPVSELKYIVTPKFRQEWVLGIAPVSLQPEGNRPENIKRCLSLIREHPSWRLSLQLQKILNIS